MKAEEHLKYIAIGNLNERSIIADYVIQNKREKVSKFKSGAKDIMEKLILISITASERHTDWINDNLKILTAVDRSVKWVFLGNNFILHDKAIVTKEYPERLIYQMLSELENKTLKTLNTKFFNTGISNTENINIRSYVDEMELFMVELYRKFQDPGCVDRLYTINKDVEDVKHQMSKNVKKVMLNIDDASLLDVKSKKIYELSNDYRENAKELKKVTRCRNWKMNFAIGGVAGSAIGYFLWLFLK